MLEQPESPKSNSLLAALPEEEYQRLLPHLQYSALSHGTIIFESDEPLKNVYFPISGTVSIITILRDGTSVEVGVVGREGMVGLPVVLGFESVTNRRAMVQDFSNGYHLKAGIVRENFMRCGPLHSLLLRYTHVFLAQVSQTAACNRRHLIAERLARWLLVCHDRIGASEVHLTQDTIATMLGTRRAGVSEAASQLEQSRLIRCRRGTIQILDRKGLECAACECYSVVKAEYDRLYQTLRNEKG